MMRFLHTISGVYAFIPAEESLYGMRRCNCFIPFDSDVMTVLYVEAIESLMLGVSLHSSRK